MSVIRGFINSCLQTQKLSLIHLAKRKYSNGNFDFKEEKINVGEYQINYLKTGTGPYNVLLMPGSMGSIWTHFEPQIKGLSKDLFTIYAWDPPGYGKSIPPEREFPVDFYERDADHAFFLMRALDVNKFFLMGWSDGGISSIFLAAKYPNNVKKAVLWGTNSHILRTELAGYENIRDLSKWSKKMKDPLIEQYGEKYLSEMLNKWCDGMNNIYKTNRGDICLSKLELVKCPTLILHGEKDSLVHSSHIPFLSFNIELSKLHTYPEGKHDIHLKYSEDFNKTVTEFLVPAK